MDNHAARKDDDLIHSSIFADITSIVAEGAAYAVIGAAVGAAAAAAAPLAGAGAVAAGLAAVGSSCLLSGIIGGVLANLTGVADDISAAASGLGNFLFPPSVSGKITSGAVNVLTNGKQAARAAGKAPDARTPPPEPQSPLSFLDYGRELLGAAGQIASSFWQPVVAGPAAGASPLQQDTISCEKHSGPQYLAEGSSTVLINGQPAVRARDRSTCEATVSDEVSPDVVIGGNAVVVREIKSGKTPGLALAMMILPLLRGRPGQVLKNMPCALAGAIGGMAADMAVNAAFSSFYPVHAATGVKVLNDDNDLDFSLPGRFPLRWQRNYNSLTTREGLFGRGWATLFDTYLELNGDEATLYDETGRELRFQLPEVREPLYSLSEGLIIRRGPDGALVIADDDGSRWCLYRPTRHNPAVLRLASVSDEYANGLELSYDEAGRLVRLHDAPCAIDVTLHYEDTRHPRCVTALSHFDGERHWPLMRYGYDGHGQLATVTDAAEVTTRAFRYNDQQLMVWHRLPGGLESEYRWAHFDHWRVIENRTSTGDGCRMDYDLDAGLTTVTTYDGETRQHYQNAQALVTRFVDERGASWLFDWDENEQLIATTDPLGNTVRYRYDDAGNRVEEIDADHNTRATQWLAHRALPTAVTEADGATTRFYYDERHALSQVVLPGGGSERFERDEYGQVTAQTDAAGGVRRLEYNEAGQVIRATDCSGYTTRYRYHPLGWLLAEITANGEETRYEYDAAGRPVALYRPENWQETLEWSPQGLPLAHHAADGRRSEFRYDAAGRLTATRNPQGHEVQREYDNRGRMTALVNENGERYGFNWGKGSLLEVETGLDGTVTHYGYDACGRTVSRTFAYGTPDAFSHHFRYDPRGILIARATPEAETRWQVSATGQLLQASVHPALGDGVYTRAADQTVRFEYDPSGALIAEEGENGRVGYQYDALGNRTAVTLPDGRQLKQLYYGSGHLLSIALDGLPVSDFTRDTLHRELSRSQGTLTSRSGYDRLGRLQQRDVFAGQAQRPAPRHWSRHWDYDYRNNLIREEQDDNPFSWRRWQYDSAGRLLKQDGAQPDHEQWSWDAASNPQDGGVAPVRHNRVTRLNGIHWRYDAFGRVAEKDNGRETWHYRYDSEHRLSEVVHRTRGRDRPETHVSFRYDPLGRRISKSRWQAQHGQRQGRVRTTRFVWEGMRLLQEIHDEVPLTYVYADQGSYEPLARIDGVSQPEIYWFHCAPNGMPERLTDTEGEVRWHGHNSAWGKLLREERLNGPGYAQNLRMQGQYLDRETGLHYNLFRYYDPDCGRFTQPDPIGLAGGINLYQYAPNALGWVDPWGLMKCSAPNGYKSGDVDPHGKLSPGVNRAVGHKNSKADGFVQSHHPIQDAWAKKRINDYQRNSAPATLLKSSSGSPHAAISTAQRARRAATGGWDTTLKQEFNISYKEMLDAGVPTNQARKSLGDAFKYFDRLRESNMGNPFFDI
ncbi:Type IV secretion protein Rhs [Paramixta manurensis]|uniref:Type IV secretion protein Rhs n=1 Tax=Paramixta manurensis TaxID=2740817 RepID=A0A6M8UFZ4_9GAMM|nr:Type IV secretion protein Rhs [Erwiniaceae bacterium PD-1]